VRAQPVVCAYIKVPRRRWTAVASLPPLSPLSYDAMGTRLAFHGEMAQELLTEDGLCVLAAGLGLNQARPPRRCLVERCTACGWRSPLLLVPPCPSTCTSAACRLQQQLPSPAAVPSS
jgi:hypothetical protein